MGKAGLGRGVNDHLCRLDVSLGKSLISFPRSGVLLSSALSVKT